MDTFPSELYTKIISDQITKDIVYILSSVDEIPFSDLMTTARVSKNTADFYLSKLEHFNIIYKKNKGNHRYYSINSLYKERLGKEQNIQVVSPKGKSIDKELHNSRTCYDHLAGKLGVMITNYLIDKKILIEEEKQYIITETGEHFFANKLEINLKKVQNSKRIIAGKCLDCSERKYHLSGSLGAAMLTKLIKIGWLDKIQGRKVIVTYEGKEGLVSLFDDLKYHICFDN